MKRRIITASVACAAVLASASVVSAQPTNMSDGSGPLPHLFSRGLTRAFAAPPPPAPTLISTPALNAALCVERTDAMLVYASISGAAYTNPQRTALALMRGGPGAPDAADRMRSALLAGGAPQRETDELIWSVTGLLGPADLTLPDVATAVTAYNALVTAAPTSFLASPPAELTALRLALGRLTAAANNAVMTERVYPDLPPSEVRYANGAPWLDSGMRIDALDGVYLQYGDAIAVGERRFRRVAEYDGVWVLAEEPVGAGAPAVIYVPVRTYCDIELMPFALQEPVIKRMR